MGTTNPANAAPGTIRFQYLVVHMSCFSKKSFINHWSCSVSLPLPFSTILIASHTRGDFGIVPGRNVIHGSDAVESGEREVDCNGLTNMLVKRE